MTWPASDPIQLLPSAVLERLARFASEFERLDSAAYPLFTPTSASSASMPAARDLLRAQLRSTSRYDSAQAALDEFRAFAVRALSEATGAGARAVLLTRPSGPAPDERIRFLGSLELAVATLILWDDLEVEERDTYLGPWVEIVGRAVEE